MLDKVSLVAFKVYKYKNTKGDNYDFTFYLEFSTTSNHTF